MKRILFIVFTILVFSSLSYAARLVSDNSTESPQTCEFDGVSIPCVLNAHGGIDTPVTIADLGVGTKIIKARYCVQDGLWCSEWSSPLSVTVPALNRPGTIKLSK
jgi:hypothetical protein